jgi:DNA-binding Xre family transcriptional regulator
MALKYYKLFDMLNRRNMKKSDLYKILSSSTVAKLSRGEYISGAAIEKICEYMHCQPGDIMEYIEPGTDMTTGKDVEIAWHDTWNDTENKPDPDNIANVYPSDEDSPYSAGYKERLL